MYTQMRLPNLASLLYNLQIWVDPPFLSQSCNTSKLHLLIWEEGVISQYIGDYWVWLFD